MKVRDVMTPDPTSCDASTSVRLAARLMSDHDCAAIPVTSSGKLVGIITDRDITCRAVTSDSDAQQMPVAACMTQPIITVSPDDSVDQAVDLMEENSLHHLPVMKEDGTLVGVVAQSDIGRRMTNREFGALSRMTSIRSRIGRKFISALVKAEH